MAKIELVVCDVCMNQEEGATRFEIRAMGKSVQVELCDTHAKPVRTAMEAGTEVAYPRGTPRPRSGFKARMASMEEIEARKKKARKS